MIMLSNPIRTVNAYRWRRFFLQSILLIASAAAAMAQGTSTASLSASFLDATGALIPEVEVTLTNDATALERRASSEGTGIATIPLLSPGTYTLRAERDGFRPAAVRNVSLQVGDNLSISVRMQVGARSESVTVTGDSAIEDALGISVLQTQSAEVSLLVNGQAIRDVPLNGRNFQRLLQLSPGVGTGNNPAVNGARPTHNTYIVDGVLSTEERVGSGFALKGGASGFDESAPNVISTEAIEEFRFIGSNADASYGRTSGGQTNLVTRSGTNDFHGSAYEYLRNNQLDARDFFNTGPFFDSQGRAQVPPFKQNLFGFSTGGSIRQNRHFFFGNYEGFRQRRQVQSGATATLPNADLIGLIPGEWGRLYRTYYIDRGLVPESGNPNGIFSPLPAADREAAIAAGFPEIAVSSAGTVIANITPTRNLDQDSFTARTDHQLTDRLSLSARYAFARPTLISNDATVPVDFTINRRQWQLASVQSVYTISPSQLFEFRLGVLRTSYSDGLQGGLDPRLAEIGVNVDHGLRVNSSAFLGTLVVDGQSNFIDNQTVPQLGLTHTWVRGRLSLRSGLSLRKNMLNIANVTPAQPSYNFSGLVGPNGLFGAGPGQAEAIPASASVGAYFGTNGGPTTPMRGWRSMQQEYLVQGDWRVRPNLTLNLGLHYTYNGVYSEVNNAYSNLYAVDSSGSVVPDVSPWEFGPTANQIVAGGTGVPFYQPDRNNFQPRLGIAWNFRDGSVLRAGYGVFTDRLYQVLFSDGVTNPPFAAPASLSQVSSAFAPITTITPEIPSIRAVDPQIRDPHTQRFNVSFEQRLDPVTTVTVAYVGAVGTNLLNLDYPNGWIGFPQEARPNPDLGTVTVSSTQSRSRYDSLQIFSQRRMSRGVSLTASYTYGNARDNYTYDSFGPGAYYNLGASPEDGFQGGGDQWAPRSLDGDCGNSIFDIRHTFTLSHIVDLPFGSGQRLLSNKRGVVGALVSGWSLTGLLTIRSGTAVDIVLGADAYDSGDWGFFGRPALISGSFSDLYSTGSDRTQYLITADEASRYLGLPSPYTPDPAATVPRHALQGPAVAFYDAALMKTTRLTERASLRFEVNAFNLFNRTNLAAPDGYLGFGGFGRISSTESNPRQIQLGVKLLF